MCYKLDRKRVLKKSISWFTSLKMCGSPTFDIAKFWDPVFISAAIEANN